jgi:polysaccharide biosynthesis protein PslH
MRILYILTSLQHPAVPGSLRHYYFLRAISQRHRITLLSRKTPEIPHEAMEEISGYAERVLTFPDIEQTASTAIAEWGALGRRIGRKLRARNAIAQMRQALVRLIETDHFDVVLFHGKDVYQAIAGVDGLPLVVDFCDATTLRQRGRLQQVRGIALLAQLWRYLGAQRIERKLLNATPHLAFISPRDRDAVLGADGRSSGAVIPNGVDLEYWKRKGTNRKRNSIVFSGVMSYPPNEDAALYLIESVLPLLRPHLPDLEIIIAGRNPTQRIITAAECNKEVTVTGYVEDIRPILERASVFVAPIRFASGMQNKILEALALELPVVTTPIVADGLRVDEHISLPLRLANEPHEFAAHTLSLLGDEEEFARLTVDGRHFVQSHFNWDRSASLLEAMCLKAIEPEFVPQLLEV